MRIIVKLFFTVVFMAALCFAITSTEEEGWLTLWFILFFFIGIPLSLVVLKDLLIGLAPKWLCPSQLLLHICAIFAGLIGYALGVMAVESGHEKAHIHQLMVVIFPLMVYMVPLLMVFHGLPLSKVKEFYINSKGGNR